MKKLSQKLNLYRNMRPFNLKLVFFFFFFSLNIIATAQLIFNIESFHGGVTGAGFSTSTGNGSGNFDIYIEPGSSIKKAWLLAQRIGNPEPQHIIINDIEYTFDTLNTITSFGNVAPLCTPNAVHAINVTDNISPTTINYSVTISENAICLGYSAIYLIVFYENESLPLVQSIVVLNNTQSTGNDFYIIDDINEIDNTNPVGFSLFSDRVGSVPGQRSNVYVNNSHLGLIGGEDGVNNQFIGGGVKGHFYYQNKNLMGLDDDTPDSLMDGTDGLADIRQLIDDESTSFIFRMDNETTVPDELGANIYLAWFLTYTTTNDCSQMQTTISENQLLCGGQQLQLQATGGTSYTWWPATGLSDSTIANPIALPEKTTNYTVIIKNDSGCVKTEHVRESVQPPPVPEGITTQNSLCAQNNGSVTVGSINTGSIYQYTLNGNTQSTAFFANLAPGSYNLQITDTLGCTFEQNEILIEEINNITAAFDYDILQNNPTKPLLQVPVTVQFNNQSQNANQYQWDINNQQLSAFEPQYTFTEPGVYPITLISTFSQPHCSDTAFQILEFVSGAFLDIPNIFTPNKDGVNDVFTLKVGGVKTLEIALFNRWGRKIKTEQFNLNPESINEVEVWDGIYPDNGEPAPYGVYFYTIIAIDKSDQRFTRNGNVQVVR